MHVKTTTAFAHSQMHAPRFNIMRRLSGYSHAHLHLYMCLLTCDSENARESAAQRLQSPKSALAREYEQPALCDLQGLELGNKAVGRMLMLEVSTMCPWAPDVGSSISETAVIENVARNRTRNRSRFRRVSCSPGDERTRKSWCPLVVCTRAAREKTMESC